MAGLLVVATIAQLLASPATPYSVEMTPEARAVYEQHKSALPSDLITALEVLGDQGDRSAIEFLGEIYHFGLFGQARDPRRACDLFERVAAHRADSAQNYATCFYEGSGRPRDMATARQWYTRAAEIGWTTAYCALGNMLVRGEGGERDPANGVALCRVAAERCDRDAQTDLGNYLLLGDATSRDPVEARGWYEKAARQRQANAAFVLAQIYWKGDGVERDLAVARQWWEVAHEEGRPDAAYWVLQVILVRITVGPEGQQRLDRSRLPEAIAWAEIAAESDPDPERRTNAAELLPDLRQSAGENPSG